MSLNMQNYILSIEKHSWPEQIIIQEVETERLELDDL